MTDSKKRTSQNVWVISLQNLNRGYAKIISLINISTPAIKTNHPKPFFSLSPSIFFDMMLPINIPANENSEKKNNNFQSISM